MELGKISAAGSFHLLIGKTLCAVILAVGAIVLGVFILEGDYGLYAIALVPSSLLLLFQDWGVGAGLIKHRAQCRATNNRYAGVFKREKGQNPRLRVLGE